MVVSIGKLLLLTLNEQEETVIDKIFMWRIFIYIISWHRFDTKMIFSLSTLITWR